MKKQLFLAAACSMILCVAGVTHAQMETAEDTAAVETAPARPAALNQGQINPGPSAPAGNVPMNPTEAVRNLLRVMQIQQTTDMAMAEMMTMIRQSAPGLPPEFFTRFQQGFSEVDMVEQLTPVYAKHLSPEAVQGLTAFYQTPAGQEFLAKQQVIMKESAAVGEKLGQEIAEKVVAELQAEGKM